MPIYEYRCEPCDHVFEALIRSHDDLPRCPKCGAPEVSKQLSVPAAAQTGAKSSAPPACPAPGPFGGCGAGGCGGGMCEMG